MQLSSPAFKHRGIIPSRYTCEGANVSPPLELSGVPGNAVSLVLLMHDPDVPHHLRPDGNWDHWVVYNISPDLHRFPEAAEPPGVNGKTTFGHTRYGGPCPPDREHRYFFKLYALDCMLHLSKDVGRKEVEQAMQGHILAEAELLGRYEKGKGY